MAPSHVIYARKSTESEDRQMLSIESQIEEIRRIAARDSVPIDEVLTESHSAKSPGRPVFGELMRRINRGEIQGVFTWKLDRLARNHFDHGQVLQALADQKLQFVRTSDRTYTKDGNDRFMGSFEFGVATKYIDDLRQNVLRGNRARFERGWVNHTPRIGYQINPVTKDVERDPKRFEQIRRMWDLLLTGAWRPDAILRVANEQWGFRMRTFKRTGGKPLSRATLYRIFGDPFYTGIIPLRDGRIYAGKHPPMVTVEEFRRAQELLGRPGRPRPQRHEFSFTGLMKCGNCGGMVTAEEHTKASGRRYAYYHCGRRKAGIKCRERAVSSVHLEQQLALIMIELKWPEETLTWLLKKARADIEADSVRATNQRASLEAALAATDKEFKTLRQLRLRDLVDDSGYMEDKRELDERRASLAVQLRQPLRTEAEQGAILERAFDFAQKASEVLQSGDVVRKRMVAEAVGSNYVLKDGKVALELKQPFSLMVRSNGCVNWSAMLDDVRTWLRDTKEYFRVPDLGRAAVAGADSMPDPRQFDKAG